MVGCRLGLDPLLNSPPFPPSERPCPAAGEAFVRRCSLLWLQLGLCWPAMTPPPHPTQPNPTPPSLVSRLSYFQTPIMFGVMLASATELSFSWLGLSTAMVSAAAARPPFSPRSRSTRHALRIPLPLALSSPAHAARALSPPPPTFFFCFSPVLQHGLCRPRHLVQGLHVQAVGHQHLQLRFHRRAPLLHPPDDPLRGGHHLRGHASSHRQGAPRLSLFALHSSCVSRTIPPTPLTPDSAPSALFFSLRAGGVGDPPVQLAAGWALLPLVQPGGPSQSFD